MQVPLEAESSKLFRHVLLKHELVVPEEHICICRHTKLNGIGNLCSENAAWTWQQLPIQDSLNSSGKWEVFPIVRGVTHLSCAKQRVVI